MRGEDMAFADAAVGSEKLHPGENPPVDHMFARRAEEMITAGLLDPALDLLQAGIKKFPDYPSGYQILGDLHLARGSNISATFAYFEALKRDPDNALTLMKLGDVFKSEGQLREAKKYYLSAARLDPDSAPLRARLGDHGEESTVRANAAFMTETAADLYLQQGHTDKARAIYLHLLKQSPDDNKLLEKLHRCNG
jgi:tetratricopeptide (TPR) repeat protein